MPKRDVIVIGASAGGVEALQKVVRAFPPDLPAAVFIVMHVSPKSRSLLPEILSRAGPLPAQHAQDGEGIESGRIYVAQPDLHLIVERGHIHLTSGPKEQRHRPSINVTFRTAAAAYGERVAGVILTGELDDGTAGLWEIERRGGACIIQNPEEATFPSMPLNAVREVACRYVLGVNEIGASLGKLAKGDGDARHEAGNFDVESSTMERHLTDLTCPECRGTIWEVNRGRSKDYQCRVGHTYSAKSMLAEHAAAQEKALYAAIVALLEAASLAARLATHFDNDLSDRFREEARRRERQAETIQQILNEGVSFAID